MHDLMNRDIITLGILSAKRGRKITSFPQNRKFSSATTTMKCNDLCKKGFLNTCDLCPFTLARSKLIAEHHKCSAVFFNTILDFERKKSTATAGINAVFPLFCLTPPPPDVTQTSQRLNLTR